MATSKNKKPSATRRSTAAKNASPRGNGAALAGALDRFATARVAVIGDVMFDRYVYGDVERISPEGPIPVFRSRRTVAMLGGAGNVVRNIAALEIGRAHV